MRPLQARSPDQLISTNSPVRGFGTYFPHTISLSTQAGGRSFPLARRSWQRADSYCDPSPRCSYSALLWPPVCSVGSPLFGARSSRHGQQLQRPGPPLSWLASTWFRPQNQPMPLSRIQLNSTTDLTSIGLQRSRWQTYRSSPKNCSQISRKLTACRCRRW